MEMQKTKSGFKFGEYSAMIYKNQRFRESWLVKVWLDGASEILNVAALNEYEAARIGINNFLAYQKEREVVRKLLMKAEKEGEDGSITK